ncbi:MAG TPA: DmsE family decaheme c-type cytochrome [Gammaproteobacteria bacterium]
MLPSISLGAEGESEFSRIRGKVDLALTGDKLCTRCHHHHDDPELLKIGRTRHGTRADRRTPSCTDCHGASPEHVDRPVKHDRPEIHFGRDSATPVARQNGACLACHRGGRQMHWAGSLHDARDVACTACHALHTERDPVLSKATQPQVCFACHKDKRAQVSKPYRHPILEGLMACSDCHNSHGSAGPRLMRRDAINDTCFQCHMEKRGPFLWNHQPVTEDCSICHNPHGSTVSRMLRVRPPFLCQQCHEHVDHQGTVPAVGPPGRRQFSPPNLTMARACLNCHTSIHGGNSPRDDPAGRLLQQ